MPETMPWKEPKIEPLVSSERIVEHGIRTLHGKHGEPLGKWCIHCNCFIGEHLLFCPLAALERALAENAALKLEVERIQGYADSVDVVADGLRLENAALRQEPCGDWVPLSEHLNTIAALQRGIAFFASVIKSGEKWTQYCQDMYDTLLGEK